MFAPSFRSGCVAVVLASSLAAGPTEFPELVDLDALTPAEGITVRGQNHYGYLGIAVGGGGDYNDDGIADLLVGASGPAGQIGTIYPPNFAYVFFGRPNLTIDELTLPGGLDGSEGFEMAGEHLFARFGADGSDAGDVNGDGMDDFIVGSPVYGGFDGRAYVVFGRAGLGLGGAFDVTTLDGTNGFVIEPIAPLDWAGFSVGGVGDLNGDGYDDVAVGAIYSDPPGRPGAGRTYVLFGGPNVGLGGVFDPNVLDGSNGFLINGVAEGDNFGFRVGGLGDINNDGYSDLFASSEDASPNGLEEAGQIVVIFGGPSVGTGGVIEPGLLDGGNGFLIYGEAPDAQLAYCADIGDVNDDGIDDFAIAGATPVYVIFGRPGIGLSGRLDLTALDGRSGFIVPRGTGAWLARPASRADVNHDGIDDLVFGVPSTTSPRREGVVVCFGHRNLGAEGVIDVTTLDGVHGFWAAQFRASFIGGAISGVGDVNADGVEDLLIGSWGHNAYDYITQAGRFDVLFGRAKFGDFDRDKDVDMADFMEFAQCFAGSLRPPAGGCKPGVDADFDDDGDVDLTDFGIFSQRFTGSK